MTRTALSRADLVRLAVALDDAELARLALGLGYREVESPKRAGGDVPGPDTRRPGDASVAPAPASDQHRAYYLTERRQLTPPPSRAVPPTPDLDLPQAEPEPLPPTPPLVPWSRLWPLLRAALSELAERQRIDVPRLVGAQARLRPLRRLPRLRVPRWAPAGQLILDLSPRLYPFWGDFAAIKCVVPRLRGRTGLEILGLEQGPEGSVRAWDGADWSVPRPYRAPAAEVPVLILGDLGCLGTPAERQAWARLGRQLRAPGRPKRSICRRRSSVIPGRVVSWRCSTPVSPSPRRCCAICATGCPRDAPMSAARPPPGSTRPARPGPSRCSPVRRMRARSCSARSRAPWARMSVGTPGS